jgi:hypothetical protein
MTKKQTARTNGGEGRSKRTTRNPQKPADTRSERGHGAKSPAVRERAIVALLSERTIADAAAKAGVDESTLRRWLSEDKVFQAEYAAARQAVFQSGINRVQALTAKAVDTLEDLLDANINANVRLGAARTVAEIGIHQHDAETILQKLEEMESDQRRQQGG